MSLLEAERTLLAYHHVLALLETYVRETKQWPHSWEDLAKFPSNKSPNAFDEFRERVAVRFDLTASEVAKLDSENFAAVKQIGPNYGSYGEDLRRIERLKAACRER
jgi:hypothetical protein